MLRKNETSKKSNWLSASARENEMGGPQNLFFSFKKFKFLWMVHPLLSEGGNGEGLSGVDPNKYFCFCSYFVLCWLAI